MISKPNYSIIWDEYLQTYVATADTMPLLNGTGSEPLHAFKVLRLKMQEEADKNLPIYDSYTNGGSDFDW